MTSPKRRKLTHCTTVEEQVSSRTVHSTEWQADMLLSSRTAHQQIITGDMYGRDIVQIQSEELLKGSDSSRQRCFAAADSLLDSLKTAIEMIPAREPSCPANAEKVLWRESKIFTPFPDPRPDREVKYKVSYRSPTDIRATGSFVLGTSYATKRSIPIIDLEITMPSDLFHPKDYLEFRYFHKRAYYLACIAAGLSESKSLQVSMHFGLLHGNPLLPVITVTPLNKSLKLQVQICPRPSPNLFAIDKTYPFRDSTRSIAAESSRHKMAANFWYNSTIRAECSAKIYFELLQSDFRTLKSLSQACVLLDLWLSQRGMSSTNHDGGFGSSEASLLIALLLHTGGAKGKSFLSSGYNAIQLFKGALQFLHKRDLINDPLVNGATDELKRNLQKNKTPFFWDADRGLNLLYKMSSSSYMYLKYHAGLAVTNLPHGTSDIFKATFLHKIGAPNRSYDDFLVLTLPNHLAENDRDGSAIQIDGVIPQDVFEILQEALGPRAALIRVIDEPKETWHDLRRPLSKTSMEIKVGLILEPMHYNRIVDRGPAAEDVESAAAYRKFWGPRSELRRFQDGDIVESIIWQKGQGIEAVHRQVIRYICERKLGFLIRFEGWEPFAYPGLQRNISDSLERTNNALKKFEKIRDKIRNLSRLPLQVREFVPVHLTLCETQEGTVRQDILDTLLQFESSVKWPDDVIAIQRTKIALLKNISRLLMDAHEDIICRLRLEEQGPNIKDVTFLEIRHSNDGGVIRMQIHHEREIDIISSRLIKTSSVAERQALSEANSSITRSHIRVPKHFQAVRRLGLRMPMLLPSIMLFKDWCSSHLLTSHMADQLIDLLVIHAFTSSYPYPPPSNSIIALIRILEFLATWNWRLEPLVVRISQNPDSKQLAEIYVRFRAWRKLDPTFDRLAIFAASDIEIDGAAWSQQSPSKVVASRLVSLAKAATSLITEGSPPSNIAKIFATGITDYDFVIHLDPQYTISRPSDHNQNFKNLQLQERRVGNHLADSPPAWSFIEEISIQYEDVVTLFHDRARQPLVAGLWTQRTKPRSWKLGLGYSSAPVSYGTDVNGDIEANKAAILSDIARLGGDLIKKIDLKSSN